MTLPEVLISVVLTGLLASALAMSITVVLRQTDNTSGRVNNARSEQSVSLWMPADLASADTVDTLPGSLPCTLPCPPEANIGGSNALMLTWTSQTFDNATGAPVTTTTKVSYRYMQIGLEYALVRVECVTIGATAATCSSQTVLHNLDAPPGAFIPGTTTPTWVIQVSQALDPASTGAPGVTVPVDPTLKNKNGQRVVVTINGGGDAGGAGGGTNQISLSAGGTERKLNLSTADPSGVPPFIAARSRCGGNFALVVDISGSIGATNMGATISGTPNWATVRGSIYKFIETFQGTPVNLELVKFSTSATVLGAAAGAQMYYDMLDPNQVTALKNLVGYPNTAGGLQSGGLTNWEDAFYNVFKKPDDTVQPILPKTIIFFTDGAPTYSRIQTATPTPAMNPADVPLPAQNSSYYQVGWNRANRVMRQFDADVQSLIGMFVGSNTATSPWSDAIGYRFANWQRGYHNNPERGYHLNYERGNNVVYQRGSHGIFERGNNVVWERGYHDDYQRGNNVVWEKGYHLDYQRGNNVIWEKGYHLDYQRANSVIYQYATTGVAFERFSGGGWGPESAANYLSKNLTPDSTDNHRIRILGTPALGGWTSMTKAQYDLSNSVAGPSDGVQTATSGVATPWTSITLADYNLNNTTPADATDGFQAVKVYSSPFDTWESTTQATYGTSNSIPAETDGWRTRQTATSTTWTSVPAIDFNTSNLTTDATDGWQTVKVYSTPFDTWESTTQGTYGTSNSIPAETDGWRTRQTATSTTWTSVTAAEFNASNTTADATDGWQIGKAYSSPYTAWELSTQATYNVGTNNTIAGETDGWRTRQTATSTSWSSITQADFTLSNTTADATDGFRYTPTYSSPYNFWEDVTQAEYDGGNSVAGSTDGWQTIQTATSTTWTTMTQALYNLSNTTADSTDGWRISNAYTAPFDLWEAATQTAYNSGNTTPDSTDGWRLTVSYTSPYSLWENVTEGAYNLNNTTPDSLDGWKADKVYAEPYTAYEAAAPVNKFDKDILGKFIQPVGNPVTPITDAGGNVTNAATANLYSVSSYAQLNSGMQAIALAECGGTLTIQTRLGSPTGTSALDPFTYQNSIDQKTVTTTSQFRGGTFDFQTTSTVNPTITPQNLSDLNHYTPVGWSCTAKGQPRAFTATNVPGTPWQNITVSVSANEAVSCVQSVQWTP